MESKSYAALDPETLAALDPNTSYARIRDMVGSGKRVLDVGCGPGNLATILSRAGNIVVGVDKDDAALTFAQRVCERTIAADLDSAELDDVVGDERFDIVVFADVLEHLRNPVQLLSSSRRILRDAGCVIVSIPNIAHGAVRLALLRGRFEYQQLGILDDTHLRFYTRASVLRLLSESGYSAVRMERTTASVFERSDLVPLVRRDDYDAAVVAEILRDEDAETLQFVVRAAPVAEGQVAAVLTAEITSLQQSVRMLRAQLAQAQDAAAAAARADAAVAHTNGANGTREGADRLAEVEGHYRNALELAELMRAERDEAVTAAERAMTKLDALRRDAWEQEDSSVELAQAQADLARVRGELAERDRMLAAAAERAAAAEQRALAAEQRALAAEAHVLAAQERLAAAEQHAIAELQTYRAERAQRAAAVASSAAALDEMRASYDLALGALEPLRAELLRVQRRADGLVSERDAALAREAAAEHELEQANAHTAEWREDLRAARALVAQVERELNEARDDAEALRAQRDAFAAEAAEAAERQARSTSAELEEALAETRALRRRAADFAGLLAVERTSREQVEDASDRILAVARDREARVTQSEVRRLMARSAVVDLERKLATAAGRGVSPPAVPPPAAMPPALVLRAATVGRRTLSMVPPPAGRRERLRAGLRRIRRLLPLVLLLALGSSV